MITKTIQNPETFDEELSAFIEENEAVAEQLKVFVLVLSDYGEGLREMWCPDCVHAHPIIKQALSDAGDCLLVEAYVSREFHRSQQNAFRSHPKLQLKALPQLYRVEPSAVAFLSTLIEKECSDPSLLSVITS